MTQNNFLGLVVAATLVCVGCEASYHAHETKQGLEGNRLTVGTVQLEIHKGMSSSGVMEALGSPNVLSTDEKGREVWIYDKSATDVVFSGSSWFVSAGASSQSQRTLTIIIKFDVDKRVREVAYHRTRF